MSYLNKTIFPGSHGMVFTINTQNTEDVEHVTQHLMQQPGIKKIAFNREVYPYEITITTSKALPIADFQEMVKQAGFHAIHKTVTGLD